MLCAVTATGTVFCFSLDLTILHPFFFFCPNRKQCSQPLSFGGGGGRGIVSRFGSAQ